MRLSAKGMALASGMLWGGGLLAVGLINLKSRRYGRELLDVTNSLYPGARGSRSITNVLVRTAYGVLDGAVSGFLFATAYNALAGEERGEAPRRAMARGGQDFTL